MVIFSGLGALKCKGGCARVEGKLSLRIWELILFPLGILLDWLPEVRVFSCDTLRLAQGKNLVITNGLYMPLPGDQISNTILFGMYRLLAYLISNSLQSSQ